MLTLLNPTKTEDLMGYTVTSLPCPTCGDSTSIYIDSSKLYAYNQGALAQVVLEGYAPEVRERFITGICNKCWQELYNDEVE